MNTPTRYKCHNCLTIVPSSPCPVCNEKERLEPVCENDHLCTCNTEITDGMRLCPVCGAPTCPCGCHDVTVISRVTGYLSDVSGWNNGKKQELVDRVRYNADKDLI